MKIGMKEGVAGVYLAFAASEVALYILSGSTATYIIPLALASATTGVSLRLGYEWASILVWATGIVTFIFGSSTAYAGLRLGSASMVFGLAMVVFSIGAIAHTVYVSLNLPKLRTVD